MSKLKEAEHSLDCGNSVFTDDSLARLKCNVTGDHCQNQFYCGIVEHAVNRLRCVDCSTFTRNTR